MSLFLIAFVKWSIIEPGNIQQTAESFDNNKQVQGKGYKVRVKRKIKFKVID